MPSIGRSASLRGKRLLPRLGQSQVAASSQAVAFVPLSADLGKKARPATSPVGSSPFPSLAVGVHPRSLPFCPPGDGRTGGACRAPH